MLPFAHSQAYHIIALFGACAYNRKTAFWELIENVGAPILCIIRLTSVPLYASRGAYSLRGACAPNRHNTVITGRYTRVIWIWIHGLNGKFCIIGTCACCVCLNHWQKDIFVLNFYLFNSIWSPTVQIPVPCDLNAAHTSGKQVYSDIS